MIVKITIEVDSDVDLTTNQLYDVQAEMYGCCHEIEQLRLTKDVEISCKPLNVDGVDRKDLMP